MPVKGTLCGFCRYTVEQPCGNSDAASRCMHHKPFTENDAVELLRKARTPAEPLDVQIGGDHYKRMPIQPITYIEANGLGFSEGNVVKYVTRWKFKGGIQDLEKARDVLTKKIDFERKKLADGSNSKP